MAKRKRNSDDTILVPEQDPEIQELDILEFSPAEVEAEVEVEVEAEESVLEFAIEAEDSELGLIDEDITIAAGTELDNFESVSIEDVEFIEDARLESIVESILFASDRPVSLAALKLIFKATNVKTDKIKRALELLAVEYASAGRGVTLEEVPGGYQLRTKVDNLEFLRGNLKTRTFKLSGPALEVLSITAYKQPIVKAEIDQIRGVESGHLLRALMEKGLVNFEGKSELPGRPMQYGTTKKFLEIFGLRNLKELPTLSQIDELLPEGIGEEENLAKPRLSDISETLASTSASSYSQGEEDLEKIQSQLQEISTSSEFFEIEKQKQKEKRDLEKAQNIREALTVGESVANRDLNWLKRYDEALMRGKVDQFEKEEIATVTTSDVSADVVDVFAEDSEEPHLDDEIPYTADAEDIDEDASP